MRIIIRKHIIVATVPQTGLSTHHQDQVIALVNLSVASTEVEMHKIRIILSLVLIEFLLFMSSPIYFQLWF